MAYGPRTQDPQARDGPDGSDADWYVWNVSGFGVEESDGRAAEAIEAGENVTIIFTP